MAWITGFKITGGILAGQTFSVGGGSLSDTTWTDAPDINSNVFDRCYGENDGTFEGVNCLVALQNVNVNDTIVLWSLEIKQDTYYKSELLCKMHCINNTGGFETELYRRDWTDSQTYNDTLVSNYMLNPQFKWNNPHEETKKIHAVFVQSNYNNYPVYFVGFSSEDYVNYWQEYHYYLDGFAIDMYKLHDVLGGNPDEGEYSPEYGGAGDIGGGYNEDAEHGSFDDSSDEIGIPPMPTLSPISAGYFHAYYLADPETRLAWIGDALFPQDPSTQPDILSALGEVAQMLFFNKQIDYVVDCHVIPCIPTYGANVPIKVGGRELKTSQGGTEYTIQAPQITNGYVDYDCGEIQIKEYWKNFLDFSNGTRCKLFLPFVGFVDILPEFFNGGELGVKYRFNVVDGSFMAFVTSTSSKSKLKDSMIAQYSGNACMHIPLQSADYSRIIGGIVSAVTTVAGASTGNLAVAGSGLVGAYTNLAGARPQMNSSNGYSASASYMSKRTPYLIIERASSQFSKNYPNEIGLPLNITRSLATITGLTIIENPVLNIDCNDEEYNEIVNLLKTGVIF